MSLKFIEYPQPVKHEDYQSAIKSMCSRLMNTGLVRCVYQVGGINDPGISDLDLYVVFKDDTSYIRNPVKDLQFPDNYLFSHRLFGTDESTAIIMERYTFFGKYNHLTGDPVQMTTVPFSSDEIAHLKNQIALEYLIKAWIAINIGIHFGRIKLRSFLLHAKAVRYDLEFLDLQSVKLTQLVDRIIGIRNNWFIKQESERSLCSLVFEYNELLTLTIEDCLQHHKFYLPPGTNLQIARNIFLQNDSKMSFDFKGFNLWLPKLRPQRLDFKIRNKFSDFIARIPITYDIIPSIIGERYTTLKKAFYHNKINYPGFICTGHGIDFYKN
jgi:hypothetical protein